MDDIEVEALKSQEFYEDIELVEEWVGTSLEALQEEVDEYFNPKKELPKIEQKTGIENPFSGTLKGFKDMFGINGIKLFSSSANKKESFVLDQLKKLAKKETEGLIFTIYNTYKKSHKMISW
jgi:hypothetical protein